MIKRTLYFGNPAYLSTTNEQLVVEFPVPKAGPAPLSTSGEGSGVRSQTPSPSEVYPDPSSGRAGVRSTAPIEDIGVLILDNQQITISQALIAKLLANNTALITCDNTHHPVGLLLNLDGNTLQSRIFTAQVEASEPLKKQLWQQTIIAKIQNQAAVLGMQNPSGSLFNAPDKSLLNFTKDVKSGDSDNTEAKAAGYYWRNLFTNIPLSFGEGRGEVFTRDREGDPPNNLLNYGYAILRAIVARSLVGSGLLPTLGIHHRNQYNAYCLADDIMEPYRPYVDKIVCEIVETQYFASNPNEGFLSITPGIKKQLLTIPAMDVMIDDQNSPMMNAIQRTTSSLAKCYEGKARKILYPVM